MNYKSAAGSGNQRLEHDGTNCGALTDYIHTLDIAVKTPLTKSLSYIVSKSIKTKYKETDAEQYHLQSSCSKNMM